MNNTILKSLHTQYKEYVHSASLNVKERILNIENISDLVKNFVSITLEELEKRISDCDFSEVYKEIYDTQKAKKEISYKKFEERLCKKLSGCIENADFSPIEIEFENADKEIKSIIVNYKSIYKEKLQKDFIFFHLIKLFAQDLHVVDYTVETKETLCKELCGLPFSDIKMKKLEVLHGFKDVNLYDFVKEHVNRQIPLKKKKKINIAHYKKFLEYLFDPELVNEYWFDPKNGQCLRKLFESNGGINYFESIGFLGLSTHIFSKENSQYGKRISGRELLENYGGINEKSYRRILEVISTST